MRILLVDKWETLCIRFVFRVVNTVPEADTYAPRGVSARVVVNRTKIAAIVKMKNVSIVPIPYLFFDQSTQNSPQSSPRRRRRPPKNTGGNPSISNIIYGISVCQKNLNNRRRPLPYVPFLKVKVHPYLKDLLPAPRPRNGIFLAIDLRQRFLRAAV